VAVKELCSRRRYDDVLGTRFQCMSLRRTIDRSHLFNHKRVSPPDWTEFWDAKGPIPHGQPEPWGSMHMTCGL
jgi:hypothetical protein